MRASFAATTRSCWAPSTFSRSSGSSPSSSATSVMSGSILVSSSTEALASAQPPVVAGRRGESPGARAWRRFKADRLGFWSLVIFCGLVGVSLFAEVLSNDRPLLVGYNGSFYVPLIHDYPEKTFGGDFETATDYLD